MSQSKVSRLIFEIVAILREECDTLSTIITIITAIITRIDSLIARKTIVSTRLMRSYWP